MSSTQHHDSPHKMACLTPQEIEARLKAAGVQATAQRIAIARYVLCEADHPTADDVKNWCDQNFPKLSLATVYNTLGILVQAKLLREFKFAHSERVVYDSNLEPHFHFVDDATGTVMDLPADLIDVKTRLGAEFRIRDIDVVLRGERSILASGERTNKPSGERSPAASGASAANKTR